MSWNLFNRKKSVSEDRDFDLKIENVRSVGDATKHLNKDIKKLIISGNMYGKAISKLNHDLNMELTTNLSEFLTNFDAITHKQEKIIKEMITGLDQTLAAPLKKYATVFPRFDEIVKKHEKSKTEFFKLNEKLQKYEEQRKISNTLKIDQLKNEIKPVKKEYEEIKSRLSDEIPKFYKFRLDYLHPSLTSLINIQKWFVEETLESIQHDNQFSNESCGDNDISDILEEIRTLCITSDE